MNPLYLHGEGYEEEVSVNTILGVVFPKRSEETRRARVLRTHIPESMDDVEMILRHEIPACDYSFRTLKRHKLLKEKLLSNLSKFLDS